jgi:shikimate dehydrogenase/3-dehydroquinate dehydratase type I
MTEAKPVLIVSLPARGLVAARREIEIARAAGADLAEIRLDRWPAAERARVRELFPSPLPLVGTLRSRAEGGEGPDEPEERARALRDATEAPFAYIDLEAARDLPGESLSLEDRRTVLSSHLSEGTPWSEVVRQIARPARGSGVRKVVVFATLAECVDGLLPHVASLRPPRPVVLTTGPSGSLWRVWAVGLGIPWVFTALPESEAVEPVEPAQIPIDQMVQYRATPGAPIFAVVGHPISHSKSPALHNGWMRADARPGIYVRLDIVSESEFRRALAVLPERGVRGINVTHPWKQVAYSTADERTDDARAAGTANCLSFTSGRSSAENTDLGAMRRRLDELVREGRWDGTELAVLGGGGAARATLAAARARGARATVFARDPRGTSELLADFGARDGGATSPARFGLVVHATDVGRVPGRSLEVPLRELLGPRSFVLDWVYDPPDRTIARTALASGASYEDGRRLLIYQAAESYRTWWGTPPAPIGVEAALREAGCGA